MDIDSKILKNWTSLKTKRYNFTPKFVETDTKK